MRAEAWEKARSLEEYTAVVPTDFSRIHGDDERASVAAFTQGVIDHRAIIDAVVQDWRQFEMQGDHSGSACGQGLLTNPDKPMKEGLWKAGQFVGAADLD